jgi:hypothetical protein
VDSHDQRLNVKVKNNLRSAYSLPIFKHTKVDR